MCLLAGLSDLGELETLVMLKRYAYHKSPGLFVVVRPRNTGVGHPESPLDDGAVEYRLILRHAWGSRCTLSDYFSTTCSLAFFPKDYCLRTPYSSSVT